jgi:hypothetical protein
MTTFQKYLKYKNKYINYNMKGGDDGTDEEQKKKDAQHNINQEKEEEKLKDKSYLERIMDYLLGISEISDKDYDYAYKDGIDSGPGATHAILKKGLEENFKIIKLRYNTRKKAINNDAKIMKRVLEDHYKISKDTIKYTDIIELSKLMNSQLSIDITDIDNNILFSYTNITTDYIYYQMISFNLNMIKINLYNDKNVIII